MSIRIHCLHLIEMHFINTQNYIILETLTQRIIDYKNGNEPKKVNQTFCDFDGVLLNISNHENNRKLIKLSIYLSYFNELKEYGAMEVLKRIYGNFLISQPIENYSITLLYNIEEIASNYEAIVNEASLIKRNCFAALFEKYFKLQQENIPTKEQAVIHYRDDETLYVEAREDRVTVIIATQFKDPEDVLYGNIFLQQYVESRKVNKTSPQIIFSNGKPPIEMANIKSPLGNNNVFYIAFVLEKRHTNKEVMGNTIDLIHIFRDNLHYHIKDSRRYVHCRMTKKYNDFIKILQRAHLEANTSENRPIHHVQKKGMVRKQF
ncbi:Actin-related protein 2/3 complex subunit 2 [Strongyloides ratti]|uniref:Arp2/3 complex 34 kDa subunit n=1 Tax=Strongyloides ratti TaxID=34506 RepID=A0A090KRI7_STRRB|nr:Actin-related protein 2/3 complex subunit 2 [Strongyloides ratti]CEF60000.1 Actin-related protein 2/3 complex subunit 2 [Strongyloides ratti]